MDAEEPGVAPPDGMDGPPEAPLEPELEALDELDELEEDELDCDCELELLLDLQPANSAMTIAIKQQRIIPCDLTMILTLVSGFFRLVLVAITVA